MSSQPIERVRTTWIVGVGISLIAVSACSSSGQSVAGTGGDMSGTTGLGSTLPSTTQGHGGSGPSVVISHFGQRRNHRNPRKHQGHFGNHHGHYHGNGR